MTEKLKKKKIITDWLLTWGKESEVTQKLNFFVCGGAFCFVRGYNLYSWAQPVGWALCHFLLIAVTVYLTQTIEKAKRFILAYHDFQVFSTHFAGFTHLVHSPSYGP